MIYRIQIKRNIVINVNPSGDRVITRISLCRVGVFQTEPLYRSQFVRTDHDAVIY